MKYEKDWEDLIKNLNEQNVNYCIIGAIAVSYHSKPRYTSDIDILTENSLENSKKTVKAISTFMGISSESLSHEYDITDNYFATDKSAYFQIGEDPVKIHIINNLDKLNTNEILNKKIKGTYGNENVYFIPLTELIKSKKIANRNKDKEDLKHLENAKRQKEKREKGNSKGFSR